MAGKYINYNNTVRPSVNMIDGFVSVLHCLVLEWMFFLYQMKEINCIEIQASSIPGLLFCKYLSLDYVPLKSLHSF